MELDGRAVLLSAFACLLIIPIYGARAFTRKGPRRVDIILDFLLFGSSLVYFCVLVLYLMSRLKG